MKTRIKTFSDKQPITGKVTNSLQKLTSLNKSERSKFIKSAWWFWDYHSL